MSITVRELVKLLMSEDMDAGVRLRLNHPQRTSVGKVLGLDLRWSGRGKVVLAATTPRAEQHAKWVERMAELRKIEERKVRRRQRDRERAEGKGKAALTPPAGSAGSAT